MKSSHTSLYLGCTSAPNVISFVLLDEDTSKEADKICCVKKHIGLVMRHELIDSSYKVVFPHSILPTHVLFLIFILFLTTLEQALCFEVSDCINSVRTAGTNWLLSSYPRGRLALGTQTQEFRAASQG